MIREEAIEVIKAYKDKLTNSASNQLDGDIEAFDMAINSLKQEPCDDCVSRQAVRDFAKTVKDNSVFFAPTYADFDRYLAKLPSVLPKREQGEWIPIYKGNTKTEIASHCSRCDYAPKNNNKTRLCPNCGAEMR